MIPLFFILFLGEMGVPFPAVLQAILLYAGYQLSLGQVRVLPLLAVAQVGRQAGSGCVYLLARSLEAPFLHRYGRLFQLPGHRLEPGVLKLHLPAPLAVALGRLTPGLLLPTSLLSGALKVHYAAFAIGIAISAIIWDGTFVALGALLGRHLQQYSQTLTVLYPLLILVLIVVLLVAVGRFVLSLRKGNMQGSQ